ncbi:MAG TPA: HAD-IA family hydrolase [Burkholderiales bacterium]|nr:HAD-IA family hydrolase [Burkholderiales bacterium]
MRYPLIVFDWDGTIIDSASTIAECIRLAAADVGLPVPSKERASHVIGLGLQDALRHAVPSLPPERIPQFVERYREHFRASEHTMGLFGGMRELLVSLHPSRTLAIATGKSRRGLDRALDATGLRPYFRASRCADETHPKPHPAMLLELMDELGVAPEGALMIGDTTHDLEMARAAGVDALAVTYGAHAEEGLRSCQPRACVASVAELERWLIEQG